MESGAASLQSVTSIRQTSNPVSPLAANIPCNEKGTDYKTLANQALGTIMSEVAEFDSASVDGSIAVGTWKSLVNRDGIDIYFKVDRHSKQRVLLAQTKIYCPMEILVDYILDPSTRMKYDTIAKENYVLQEFDDTTTFNYASFTSKTCMMEYNIDLCYLATHRTVGNKHIIAYTSILDNPYAPSIADVKRGWLYHSGYEIEETEDTATRDKCLFVSMVIHVDMRLPDMPPAVRNALLERQGMALAMIRDEVEGYSARESRFYSNSNESFDVRRLPSDQSLNMELSLGGDYNSHFRVPHTGSPSSSSNIEIATNLGLRRSAGNEYGSHPDLCFWSLDDDAVEVGSDVDDATNDYVTMANSAAASLYREYINVLEAVRFAAVCPEKLGWKVLERNDEVWTLEKKGSTIQCMAGVANIRASEREIMDFLRDPRTRFTYDATLYKTNVVAEINEDLRLVYAHHKARSCFIGHGRDLLYFQYDRKEGDKRILAHASCEHHRCPVNPDIIRSTMYETGFIIEPLPEVNVSSVVYVVKLDLKLEGVPDSLVRFIKRKQPKILMKIKEYFEK